MATNPTTDTKKMIVFDNEVLEKIAGRTASEVDGVLGLQGNLIENLSGRFSNSDNPETGVSIDQDNEQKTVAIEMTVILEYGKRSEEILDKISTKVVNAIKLMTNYQVTEIKLQVKDMLTREEWQQKNNTSKKEKSKKDRD